jgi:phosphatidylglycerophosphate synthase
MCGSRWQKAASVLHDKCLFVCWLVIICCFGPYVIILITVVMACLSLAVKGFWALWYNIITAVVPCCWRRPFVETVHWNKIHWWNIVSFVSGAVREVVYPRQQQQQPIRTVTVTNVVASWFEPWTVFERVTALRASHHGSPALAGLSLDVATPGTWESWIALQCRNKRMELSLYFPIHLYGMVIS